MHPSNDLIRAIIFDMDGTLINSTYTDYLSWQRFLYSNLFTGVKTEVGFEAGFSYKFASFKNGNGNEENKCS